MRQFTDWLAQTGGIPPERDFNTVGSPWRTIEEGIRLYTSWSFDKKTDVFTITDHVTSSDRRPHAYTLLFHLDTTNTVVSTDGRRLR